MSKLRGKTALVTGGGSGIGLAVARSLLDAGANVAITGRDEAKLRSAAGNLSADDLQRAATQQRVMDSAEYLAAHMHEAPVHLIPCINGRYEGLPIMQQAGLWGSILPATWSFMLAARARGLGTSWTTIHLFFEQEAAELLGIPYSEVTQAALIPAAYTQGLNFTPATREPLESSLHWNGW